MDEIIKQDIVTIVKNLESFRDKINGKTFLITGGSGFLGSWFCDVVIEMGAKVICVDNLISGDSKNINHLLSNQNFKFINSNILDFDTDEKIDYIVHMASIASPPLYMEYPIETLDANVLGTKKMLELAKRNNVKGFLFMSTSEVYGNPPDEFIPTPENFHGIVNSFGPRSVYDEGKRVAEAYCFAFFQKFKLPIRITRTFNTYGPRLDTKSKNQYGRALIKFVSQSMSNEPISVYGDGKQTRSFCYITDQIEGLFRLLLMSGLDGHVINIGNDKEIQISELANLIISITGSKSKIEIGARSNYNITDDPRRRCPDISKARRLLNYNPKISLEEGLKKTTEWVKKVEDIINSEDIERIKKIFRAYDVRGIYGSDLTEKSAELIGKGFGTFAGEGKNIVIGRDGRLSSKILRDYLSNGLRSVGCNVIDLGLVTTPMFYFAIAHFNFDGGIVISASHNPKEWNGFKMAKKKGLLLAEGFGLEKVKEIILQNSFNKPRLFGKEEFKDIVTEYQQFILNKVKINKKFKVVVDTANGVCGLFAPTLLRKLGCDVITINEEVDGNFPNRNPDPREDTLTELRNKVIDEKADFGIGFDGDGDRVVFVDDKGNFITGSHALLIFSDLVLKQKQNAKIVFDLTCSSALEEFISRNGGIPIVSRVGHAYVMNRMFSENADFAGEYGGKFFFPEIYGFDDAMYASLKIAEIIENSNKKLSEIFEAIPKYNRTQITEVPCDDSTKFKMIDQVKDKILQNSYKFMDIDGVKVFDKGGWVLIRASNTSPVIRVNAEAKTEYDANNLQNWGINLVKEEIGKLENSNN